MIIAVAFMACAAFRAQTAYRRKADVPLAAESYANSAIRLGLAGAFCFVVSKVLP